MSAETIIPPEQSAALPSPSLSRPRVSVEEYLLLERQSDTRHEYVDGERIAMAGETLEHNLISGNIFVEFRNQMRDRPCDAYMEKVRVRVSQTQYRYPDVVALCGAAALDGENPPAILNPTVIVEVLSPSTQHADRNDKFYDYHQMQSLTDYVLVAQDRVSILHYVRQNERQWVITEVSDLNDSITFGGLDITLALSDVYRKLSFNAPDVLKDR